MRKSFAMLIGTVLLVAGLAFTQETRATRPATDTAADQPQVRDTYRLDYTITELEDGKKLNSRTYTLTCQDDSKGVLKVGSRVPISTGASPGGGSINLTYLDVGMNIDATVRPHPAGQLVLRSMVEMSSIADTTAPNQAAAPVIRQFRSDSENAVPVGRPVVIAVADDVASHRQFQIQVVATRLK